MQRAGAGGAAVLLNACGRASTDLALTVNDSPDPVQEGGTLTYSMTVTNNGPVAASNVSLTATLPASTTVTSVTPAAGTCAAPTAGCDRLQPRRAAVRQRDLGDRADHTGERRRRDRHGRRGG